MKKMNNKIACGILAASMFAASLAGCGKLDGTQTAATIDGEKVTLGLASYVTRDQQAQTESYYAMFSQSAGMDMTGNIWDQEGEDGKTMGESSKDDAMDTLKGLYAMKAHAEEYGVEISEEEQTKLEEAAKAFMEANSEETLAELAVSEADIVTYLELMTIRQKMHDPMVADVDTEVDADEINQSKVTVVKVTTEGTEMDEEGQTIALTDEEKAAKKELAEAVYEKVKASDDPAEADMDALAKEVDETLSASSRNFTTAGSEEETLDEKVRESVADLEDGDLVSQVVEGRDGYYVVRLDLKHDEEATQNKKDSIILTREQEMYDELLDEWKGAVELKIEEDVWKKVKVTDKKSFQYKAEETEAE
ncbi:MAG: peptidyl-prolyl cis-trans isomerase [Clostridiales bacterium]|nr:peptidyl-prolyl cis-trans isomerase [Clostridiales bacterium]